MNTKPAGTLDPLPDLAMRLAAGHLGVPQICAGGRALVEATTPDDPAPRLWEIPADRSHTRTLSWSRPDQSTGVSRSYFSPCGHWVLTEGRMRGAPGWYGWIQSLEEPEHGVATLGRIASACVAWSRSGIKYVRLDDSGEALLCVRTFDSRTHIEQVLGKLPAGWADGPIRITEWLAGNTFVWSTREGRLPVLITPEEVTTVELASQDTIAGAAVAGDTGFVVTTSATVFRTDPTGSSDSVTELARLPGDLIAREVVSCGQAIVILGHSEDGDVLATVNLDGTCRHVIQVGQSRSVKGLRSATDGSARVTLHVSDIIPPAVAYVLDTSTNTLIEWMGPSRDIAPTPAQPVFRNGATTDVAMMLPRDVSSAPLPAIVTLWGDASCVREFGVNAMLWAYLGLGGTYAIGIPRDAGPGVAGLDLRAGCLRDAVNVAYDQTGCRPIVWVRGLGAQPALNLLDDDAAAPCAVVIDGDIGAQEVAEAYPAVDRISVATFVIRRSTVATVAQHVERPWGDSRGGYIDIPAARLEVRELSKVYGSVTSIVLDRLIALHLAQAR
jgi:hypothetical protein